MSLVRRDPPAGVVSPVWSRPLHLRSEVLAAAGGMVVVAERHTRLAGLDAETGEQRWEQRVEDCWGSVALAADRCLYLSQAGVLHCFTLGGRRLWAVPGLERCHHLVVSGDVVFAGGWRGYRPLTRIALDDGSVLPALPDVGAIVRPVEVRPGAIVLGSAVRPVLLVVDGSGAVAGEWGLPEPVRSAFGAGAVFVCGDRTVLAFDPDDGVREVWRHDRDLRPLPPVLDGGTLWLADEAGVAVAGSGRADRRAGVRDCALVAGEALVAFTDGELGAVDRWGGVAVLSRGRRIDRLVPGTDGVVHAVGKGRLLTFRRRPSTSGSRPGW
ncbi:PQQ-binding-like beta-propeller repeat protein [Actinoplanes sp. NPDC023714]|uniref:outer membrane protein assembly factor BamB family protein n=1 Tax=Actinoplanes sp. NPDC023714 TaxID=3154322 RepID=UPI0033F90CED